MKSLIAAILFVVSSACMAAELTVEMAKYSKGPNGMYLAFSEDAEVRISAMNNNVTTTLDEIVAEATQQNRYVTFKIEGLILNDVTTYHWRTGHYRVINFLVKKIK